jgi:hypothetical protein
VDLQLRIASKQPIHFPELDVELITFFLNMLFPPQLGIKIFCCVGIWNFCTIDEDWLLSNLLVCEVNIYQFGFVEFYSPFSCPDSDFVDS